MAWPASIAGAHLKVLVNGRLLGWAVAFTPRTATPVREARGIDSSVTFELMPTTYDVQGQMQVLRGRLTGGLEGAGIVAFARDLLKQRYSTIELVDRISDTVVYKAIGCIVTDQSWRIAPKQLVLGTFTFKGIDCSNEADQQ